MNTTCMYLSEARSKVRFSTYPRLPSLRSVSLGLLRVCLFEALSMVCLPYVPRLHSLRSLSLGLLRASLRGCDGPF